MRINDENKSIDIEPREINYIMEALVTSYLFHTKNQMPEVITFPMYKLAKTRYGEIPINFVPDTSEAAEDIIKDGSNVPEVTPAQEAALDEKDEEIKGLKERLRIADETTSEDLAQEEADKKLEEDTTPPSPDEAPPTSPARAAFASGNHNEDKPEDHTAEDAEYEWKRDKAEQKPTPPPDRKPKQPPGGDIGPGLGLSDMHHRDVRDQARTARDLAEAPGGEIDKSAEIPYEKVIKRDDQGRPVVEELPDDSSRQE